MKPSLLFTHTLSIVSILCISISLMPMQPSSAETVAQSDAQLSLPEGARARLGKGIIRDIAYSKDGNHLIVLSSIGTWTYDARTGAALDLFNAYSLTGNISGLSPDGDMLAIGSRDHTVVLYQLSKPAEVAVHIYTANGTPVRTLILGYKPAGEYQDRRAAAYWDGKNSFGEPVASGVYFYTLTAGEFTATRKMLIQTINRRHKP